MFEDIFPELLRYAWTVVRYSYSYTRCIFEQVDINLTAVGV